MLGILLVPFFILIAFIYLITFMFVNTFGVVPRLIFAIVIILLLAFIVKNFWAVVGFILLIAFAFWIRQRFIQPHMNHQTQQDPSTFDGEFEEMDKDK